MWVPITQSWVGIPGIQKESRLPWDCDPRLPVGDGRGQAKPPQLSMARSRRLAEGRAGLDVPMPRGKWKPSILQYPSWWTLDMVQVVYKDLDRLEPADAPWDIITPFRVLVGDCLSPDLVGSLSLRREINQKGWRREGTVGCDLLVWSNTVQE